MHSKPKKNEDHILQIGNPLLRARARPVAKKEFGSKKLLTVVHRMKKALVGEEYGVAIAAPQIGESLRIFVIAGKAFISDEKRKGFDEHTEHTTPPDRVFINPEIIRLSKKVKEMSEGCLSVRGAYGTVMRHEKASIKTQDEHGKEFVYHGSGLLAHIFQHECDHLEGILYTDKSVKLEEDEDIRSARKKVRTKHNL